MTPRREWFDHRQAYAPRTWPAVVAAGLIGSAIGLVLAMLLSWYGLLISIPLAVAVGWCSTALVWKQWRRAHPELSIDEYRQIHREKAHLN